MVIPDSPPDDLESTTWAKRLARGKFGEAEFDRQMRAVGYHPIEQTPMQRADLDDRHFPDIIVRELPGVLWQVKDGRRSGMYDNVIAETASITSCRRAAEQGWKVIVVWLMPDNVFNGNYVESLVERGAISDEAREHGSGTPGTKYAKNSLFTLSELLAKDSK